MKRLVLIDGHAVLFRAFHAYPPLTTSRGELVNAVYGFTNILLNVISELKPEYIVVTFDRDKPTFRHTEYVGYKAQREPMPTELKDQQERVEEVVSALNIPIFAVEGYEADDVIGTLAKQATIDYGLQTTATGKKKTAVDGSQNAVSQVVIVTGDRDALQLVRGERVVVYMPGRGKIPTKVCDENVVKDEYGLDPDQIRDYKGLCGDASDNIAGVRGIGPKTAIKLLQEFGTVEAVYKHLDNVDNERIKKLLVDGYESALMSKKMATIVTDVPIELDLDKCAVTDYDKERVVKLFEELEFRSLIKKLPNDSFEQMVQEALF